MSFTRELTCRWSTSYWTPTKLLQVICTEIVTQELLHRSSANFQVVKLYLNPCKIRLLQFSYFSLAAGTARRWLTKCYPLRRVGHMRIFFARSNHLRRSCVSDAQTCGGMWVSFGHGQPSAEIAQVGRPNMWQNANLAKPSAAPPQEMKVNRQKTGVKLWFWKFRRKRGMTGKRQQLWKSAIF